MKQLTLTLKMTTAQVVETSVTVNNNSPIQDYAHPDDQTQPSFYIDTDEIPGFFLLLKNHIFIARSQDTIFYLSRVRILVSPWLLTRLANYCL